MWPGEDFVRDLVRRFPATKAAFDQHLARNQAELLPHVFFGELTRWVVASLEMAPDSDDHKEAKKVLDYLEESMAGEDETVRELIVASFLENLPDRGKPGGEIAERLGPALREAFVRQRGGA